MDTVQEAFDRAYHKDRQALLHPPLKDRVNAEDIPIKIFLISTFHPSGSFLESIIRKNWGLLDRSSSSRPIINWKITKGCRRPKNLWDHLVRALCNNPMDVRPDNTRVNTNKKGKTKKRCSQPNCQYCPKLDKSGSIRSPITDRKYNTIMKCDCETNNIINYIVCTCKKQYVGHTKRTLRQRTYEHFILISKKDTYIVW